MEEREEVRRRPRASDRLVSAVPGPARNVVLEVGQMCQLLGKVIYSAVRYPRGYWKDTVDEMYSLLKLCFWPATLSMAGFGFLITVMGVGLLVLLGAANRIGGFWVMADIREIAAFMVGMVVAGVIGTSITSDLGARKAREELDALKVLGLDPIRMLVIPRVIATAVMCAMLNFLTSFVGVILGLIAVGALGDTTTGAYIDSMSHSLYSVDVWGAELKTLLIGLLIGIVCSFKGLNAGGGPEGVGRAVNQAVVICFALVWVFNFFFNSIVQGLNPDLLMLR
ncbi:MlaE family ABC transporter permease [Saccharopolyspora endophytica]|uniref:ABC transporter permease n=1 Tax=Saccharopolyspora endophytica TaxID=543886 RepID=A0ABS5DB60_9PSEU|nr:ABC transporter permease [Saccharopolyspora endophytica]MBQ0923528.1 ABC transporter permease [Saccharopolyspora endophytica]